MKQTSTPQWVLDCIQQLGGNKFITMTGTDKISFCEKTKTISLNVKKNQAQVNRLRITLNALDTYDMVFDRWRLTKDFTLKIDKEQEFLNVYADQLQEIYTAVTGMLTSLGTMGR